MLLLFSTIMTYGAGFLANFQNLSVNRNISLSVNRTSYFLFIKIGRLVACMSASHFSRREVER